MVFPEAPVPIEPEEFDGPEFLSSRHFFAAYVFDNATTREADVTTVIEEAKRLSYPVRYWWLSQAVGERFIPDRLIVCVHHPSGDENAGMDLYDMLEQKQAAWDELEAATLEEYTQLGQPVSSVGAIRWPSGAALFPTQDR